MKTAFDRGLKPHKILGAKGSSLHEMMFLINWEDSEEIDMIPAEQVKLKYPQLVISFYEERIDWNHNF